MTHKIAKDIENTDRKRKISTRAGGTDGAAGMGVEAMTDTGARGSQEEIDTKTTKKVRFNEETEAEAMEPGIAESMEAVDGSTDGAAVPAHKRKKEI